MGRGWGSFGLVDDNRRRPPPRSFSLLPPCVFEERRSVTFLRLKLPRGGGKGVVSWGLITSTFLAVLCAHLNQSDSC